MGLILVEALFAIGEKSEILYNYQQDVQKGRKHHDMWDLEWRWQSGRVIRAWLYSGAIASGQVIMHDSWNSEI
ncbi:hypothetical protein ACN38_g10521 [Penicillium nordicum]|uniref:Uncharacterized protein n=1 Tax=Penicillium nordicum TaxID=229535 RepID=A0A0M8NSQ5_9EURO|nr:hypothetical protein ACN38_g10521 [Penicillium nordicum]